MISFGFSLFCLGSFRGKRHLKGLGFGFLDITRAVVSFFPSSFLDGEVFVFVFLLLQFTPEPHPEEWIQEV